MIVSCGKENTVEPTCTDGIQNGTETGIDCGGNCEKCYKIGDAGPGGGIIFYDKGEESDGWRFWKHPEVIKQRVLNGGVKEHLLVIQ